MVPELLRTLGPLVLAVVAALLIDRSMERRGLLPPRFGGRGGRFRVERRALGSFVVCMILWASAFAPLSAVGEPPPDPTTLTTPRLFLLHGLLVAALVVWYALGHLPRPRIPPGPEVATAPSRDLPAPALGEEAEPGSPQPGPERSGWRAAFRLEADAPAAELARGAAVGLAIWLLVLTVLFLLGSLVSLLGGRDALSQEPPALVLWIGALPLAVRVAVAVSAGVVEEIFFRGFLQPRVGILASTGLFALAHLGYGQPFLLVGVTLLSLCYGELLRRRGSVWAPIAAHAVFDLVQLVVVVPLVARLLEQRGTPEVALVAAAAATITG